MNSTQETTLAPLAQALGRIASGVYILTTIDLEGKPHGMMASWVMQAGFEPPMLTVAIAPERPFYKAVEQSQKLCINVVSKENTAIMKAFGKANDAPFDALETHTSAYGLHLLEAIAVLEGECVGALAPGADHHVLLVRLESGQMLKGEALAPFIHLRDSGLHY